MKLILLCSLLFLFANCQPSDQNEEGAKENTPTESSDAVTYSFKAMYKDDVGWGYQIFKGAKIMINQDHIPAVNGLFGFETREKAELAAKFVISKMSQGMEHPTVKAQELDSIGAINLDSLNTISTSNLEKMKL